MNEVELRRMEDGTLQTGQQMTQPNDPLNAISGQLAELNRNFAQLNNLFQQRINGHSQSDRIQSQQFRAIVASAVTGGLTLGSLAFTIYISQRG